MFKWLSNVLIKRGHEDVPASGPNPSLSASETVPSATELPKLPKRIGPFEYHLKQRKNNPLFPEQRQTVSAKEWEEAKVYDEGRIKEFNHNFATLFLEYTVEWGSPGQKEKWSKGTMGDLIQYFVDFLMKWDSMLTEYVLVKGTGGWKASEDELFGILLKWREKIATTTKNALLYSGDESAIRTFEEWEGKKKRDNRWRFSHFCQLSSRGCFFLSNSHSS